jgi:hypothetical protein
MKKEGHQWMVEILYEIPLKLIPSKTDHRIPIKAYEIPTKLII